MSENNFFKASFDLSDPDNIEIDVDFNMDEDCDAAQYARILFSVMNGGFNNLIIQSLEIQSEELEDDRYGRVAYLIENTIRSVRQISHDKDPLNIKL